MYTNTTGVICGSSFDLVGFLIRHFETTYFCQARKNVRNIMWIQPLFQTWSIILLCCITAQHKIMDWAVHLSIMYLLKMSLSCVHSMREQMKCSRHFITGFVSMCSSEYLKSISARKYHRRLTYLWFWFHNVVTEHRIQQYKSLNMSCKVYYNEIKLF